MNLSRGDWPNVRLADVCEIIKGGVDPQRQPDSLFAHYSIPAFDGGNGPVIEYGEKIKSQKTLIENGVVLISKLNPRIPRVWIVDDEQQHQRICSTEFVPLRCNADQIRLDYLSFALRYALGSGEIIGSTSAATKSRERAKPSDFLRLTIGLPPLSEQRRIIDLLTRAEGIVRLRREADKKATELIPALFLDMFGDPATNPKAWPMRNISEFVERFEGGKNIQAGSENGSPYRILKVSAVTSGIYQESESKPSPDGYSPPISHFVRQGDLLFSRANTEELVGATALVEATNGQTLLPDKLWRFVWAEEVEPTYVQALFQTTHIRRELGKLSSGTSVSMRNISQGKLFTLALPFASLSAQRVFAEKVRAIHSMCSQQSTAIAIAGAMFDSLLHRVFAGSHKMVRDTHSRQIPISGESH